MEKEMALDLNQKAFISGIRKQILLGYIDITDLEHRFFEDSQIHPKIKQNMEYIHNKLIRN